jgi:uncharacterized membrane protein
MMSEHQTSVPQPTTNSAKASTGMRILLAISLALNLAVGGYALGKVLDHGRDGSRGMAREMAFGPFTDALTDQDRRALARTLFERAPKMRDARQNMMSDIALIVAALNADPFDPSALEAAFAAQKSRAVENMTLAQDAIRDFLVRMSPEDRAKFAERLQNWTVRGPKT